MYTYWLRNKSRTSYEININLWFLRTIRQYLTLSTSQLSYFIASLQGLKSVNLRTTKTNYDFLVAYKLLFLVLVILFLSLVILSL